MLATLIIVFREIIEAGLVVGIVMAATRGVAKRGWCISLGVLGGVIGACLVAAFASSIANMMQGSGQEIFNASIMGVAVLMLAWHNIWMAREGRHIALEMKSLGEDVTKGRRSLMAMAIVVGVAVLREGSEIVLFLYGIMLSGGNSILSMITGGIIGLALGAFVSAAMYLGLLRIPTRHLFAVTSVLIILLASGMASQCVVFLQQAGIVTLFPHIIWDTSTILSNDSILGKALHALIGYSDRPTGMQMIVYFLTLATISALSKLFGTHKAAPLVKAHS